MSTTRSVPLSASFVYATKFSRSGSQALAIPIPSSFRNLQLPAGGGLRLRSNLKLKSEHCRSFPVCNCIGGGAPMPSGPPSNPWQGWIVGILMTFVLPFFTHKWGPLLRLKNRVDAVVQTAEDIIDAVEKVAEQVEKVAEDIADDLPEGKLKHTVDFIENVAERAAKDAHSVSDFIDKVQEVEEKVEDAVESVIDASADKEKEAKDEEEIKSKL